MQITWGREGRLLEGDITLSGATERGGSGATVCNSSATSGWQNCGVCNSGVKITFTLSREARRFALESWGGAP